MSKKYITADIGFAKVRTMSSERRIKNITRNNFNSSIVPVDNWNAPITGEEFLIKYNHHIYKLGCNTPKKISSMSDVTNTVPDANIIYALATIALSVDNNDSVILSYLPPTECNPIFRLGRQTIFIKRYSDAPVERKTFKLFKAEKAFGVTSPTEEILAMDYGYGTDVYRS